MASETGHPYSPPSAAIRGYVPNADPIAALAAQFVLLISVVVGSSLLVAVWNPYGQKLRRLDVFAVGWFALSGFLHCFFEAYFITFQEQIIARQDLFAQLWKYYGLADSRYLTGDNFTVCVETVTVVVLGPLCWLAVHAILSRSPHRHLLQAIISVAHLYSLTLYLFTEYRNEKITGESSTVPGFLYFWVYYIGFNLAWAFVPLVLIRDSWCEISETFRRMDAEMGGKKKL